MVKRISTCLFVAAALFAFRTDIAMPQTACALCYEIVDDQTSPWTYHHGFDSGGVVWRECERSGNLIGDHSSCHNDEVSGDCGTHSTCSGGGGDLLAIRAEVERLLRYAIAHGPEADAVVALVQRVTSLPNVRFIATERRLHVVDCAGRVVDQFDMPPAIEALYRET